VDTSCTAGTDIEEDIEYLDAQLGNQGCFTPDESSHTPHTRDSLTDDGDDIMESIDTFEVCFALYLSNPYFRLTPHQHRVMDLQSGRI